MEREIKHDQERAHLQAKVDTLAAELEKERADYRAETERAREVMVAYREIFNLTSQMGPVQLLRELRR